MTCNASKPLHLYVPTPPRTPRDRHRTDSCRYRNPSTTSWCGKYFPGTRSRRLSKSACARRCWKSSTRATSTDCRVRPQKQKKRLIGLRLRNRAPGGQAPGKPPVTAAAGRPPQPGDPQADARRRAPACGYRGAEWGRAAADTDTPRHDADEQGDDLEHLPGVGTYRCKGLLALHVIKKAPQ